MITFANLIASIGPGFTVREQWEGQKQYGTREAYPSIGWIDSGSEEKDYKGTEMVPG